MQPGNQHASIVPQRANPDRAKVIADRIKAASTDRAAAVERFRKFSELAAATLPADVLNQHSWQMAVGLDVEAAAQGQASDHAAALEKELAQEEREQRHNV
jgi:hypothetical protein